MTHDTNRKNRILCITFGVAHVSVFDLPVLFLEKLEAISHVRKFFIYYIMPQCTKKKLHEELFCRRSGDKVIRYKSTLCIPQ